MEHPPQIRAMNVWCSKQTIAWRERNLTRPAGSFSIRIPCQLSSRPGPLHAHDQRVIGQTNFDAANGSPRVLATLEEIGLRIEHAEAIEIIP